MTVHSSGEMMRPVSSGPVRWLICLATLIPVCFVVVFMRDDSGLGLGYFMPKYATKSLSPYGLWAGIANVALLAGIPIAIFTLLRRVLMPTNALKIFVGGVLGLLAVFVVAIEIYVAQGRTVLVTDFTLFPEEFVAKQDQAALQKRISALKSKDTEKLCDEVFMYYEVGTAGMDQATIRRLHDEYSFDRQIVVSGKPIDIETSLTLAQVLYAVDATPQCMAQYEKAGENAFSTGAFDEAAQRYQAAYRLTLGGSNDHNRLLAMYQAMKAASGSDAETVTTSSKQLARREATHHSPGEQ